MRPVLAMLAFVLLAGCVDSTAAVEPASAVPPEPEAVRAPILLEGSLVYAVGTPRAAVAPATIVRVGENGAAFMVPEGAGPMRVALSFEGSAPGGMVLRATSPGDSLFESSTGPGGTTADVEVDSAEPGEWTVTLWPLGPVVGVDWTVEVTFE